MEHEGPSASESWHTVNCRNSAIASDAGIPGITLFWRYGPQSLAELFHVVGNRQAVEKFHALVAELGRQPYAKRSTIADRKIIAIQAVSEKGLRMHRIRHIDALPPVRSEEHTSELQSLRHLVCR